MEFKSGFDAANEFIIKLRQEWEKIEHVVFDQMSKISGLPWKRDIIDVFVVQRSKPFSRPLTLPIKNDIEDSIEALIHELVHNILGQNDERVRRIDWSAYGELDRVAQVHVLVHAILKDVLVNVFGTEKAKEFIKKYDHLPPGYRKAWEIVEKEGSQNIIKNCIA